MLFERLSDKRKGTDMNGNNINYITLVNDFGNKLKLAKRLSDTDVQRIKYEINQLVLKAQAGKL